MTFGLSFRWTEQSCQRFKNRPRFSAFVGPYIEYLGARVVSFEKGYISEIDQFTPSRLSLLSDQYDSREVGSSSPEFRSPIMA